jgi:hypothetical protein
LSKFFILIIATLMTLTSCKGGAMDLPVESTINITNQKITLNFSGDEGQTLTILVEQKTVTLKSNKKKFRKSWSDIESMNLESKEGVEVLVIKSRNGSEEHIGIISRDTYNMLKHNLSPELKFL